MDRLQAMKVFVAVVEAGAFARAAEPLRLSTTAVSRLVADLERHLGARLLHRTTRRLSLTDIGGQYYERCRRILADVDEAENLAAGADAQARGLMRLSLPHSFGLAYIAPLLPAFCARHPELRLEVAFSDRFIDLAEEGFDLAVRISRRVDAQLVARPLAPVQLAACAAPAYLVAQGAPSTPEDLRRHDCLTYSYAVGGDTWRFVREGRELAVQVKGRLRSNSGEMNRCAALAGLGIALEPTFLVAEDLRAGRLVRVLPDYELESATAQVVYLPGSRGSARVGALVDYLREAFGPDAPPWER
jgi:DNA-binding transcriptional LysR family regulator